MLVLLRLSISIKVLKRCSHQSKRAMAQYVSVIQRFIIRSWSHGIRLSFTSCLDHVYLFFCRFQVKPVLTSKLTFRLDIRLEGGHLALWFSGWTSHCKEIAFGYARFALSPQAKYSVAQSTLAATFQLEKLDQRNHGVQGTTRHKALNNTGAEHKSLVI